MFKAFNTGFDGRKISGSTGRNEFDYQDILMLVGLLVFPAYESSQAMDNGVQKLMEYIIEEIHRLVFEKLSLIITKKTQYF